MLRFPWYPTSNQKRARERRLMVGFPILRSEVMLGWRILPEQVRPERVVGFDNTVTFSVIEQGGRR
jgi:hypothetical protein